MTDVTARPEERARASVSVLEQRMAAIPALVAELLAAPPALPSLREARDVVVVGIGASAGPARYLATLLACGGTSQFEGRARFVPVSAFATGRPAAGASLVLFSQHLSPNARLVLARSSDAERIVVVTSSSRAEVEALLPDARVDVVQLAPGQPVVERGMLLRVTGPAIANVGAVLLAREAGVAIDADELARVPEVLAGAPARLAAACDDASIAACLDSPLAIVASGEHGPLARAIAWKFLEGWSVPEPPVWDLLEVAHGPFQQLYGHPGCVLAIVGSEAADGDLTSRLRSMLVPSRHVLVTMAAVLPRELAHVEHGALGDALLLAGLRARPRDLAAWDGQGLDGPLYDVGR
jgi:fructoselysine-6-P-deglycase FrlB-like protein